MQIILIPYLSRTWPVAVSCFPSKSRVFRTMVWSLPGSFLLFRVTSLDLQVPFLGVSLIRKLALFTCLAIVTLVGGQWGDVGGASSVWIELSASWFAALISCEVTLESVEKWPRKKAWYWEITVTRLMDIMISNKELKLCGGGGLIGNWGAV